MSGNGSVHQYYGQFAADLSGLISPYQDEFYAQLVLQNPLRQVLDVNAYIYSDGTYQAIFRFLDEAFRQSSVYPNDQYSSYWRSYSFFIAGDNAQDLFTAPALSAGLVEALLDRRDSLTGHYYSEGFYNALIANQVMVLNDGEEWLGITSAAVRAVPEPGTSTLAALGLTLLFGSRKRIK